MLDDGTTTAAPSGDASTTTPAAPADTGTANVQNPTSLDGGANQQTQQPPTKQDGQPKDDDQKRLTPFQSRISELVKQGHTERRAREAAETERDQLRAEIERLRGGGQQQGQQLDRQAAPTQQEFDRRVREEATRVAAQQAQQAAWTRIGQEGAKEYTPAVFDAACNTLASLGAGDNPAFMAAIARAKDGHKLLHHLAANPHDAVRLLAADPTEMAYELGELRAELKAQASAAPAPKPISAAPAPTKPIGGTAGGSPSIYDPNLTTEQYAELRRKGVKT